VINLQELNYKDKIIIDIDVIIPTEYYSNTDIISLDDVKAKGDIKYDEEDNYLVNLNLTGKMMLHDSITYEEIPYYFDVNIEESLENSSKTLDLIEFLWHYIVLEIPIRFTNSELESVKTENYSVISEEEYKKKNNPFSDFSL